MYSRAWPICFAEEHKTVSSLSARCEDGETAYKYAVPPSHDGSMFFPAHWSFLFHLRASSFPTSSRLPPFCLALSLLISTAAARLCCLTFVAMPTIPLEDLQKAVRLQAKPAARPQVDREFLLRISELGDGGGEARRKFSSAYKRNIVQAQRRWQSYCGLMGYNWIERLKQTSVRNKGTINAYIQFLLHKDGSRLTRESSIRQYIHIHWAVYEKYTGRKVDDTLRKHALGVIDSFNDLELLPKPKPSIGPQMFLYLSYFRWVRDDQNAFHIGLDRLDDATIRQIQMYTGARTHEFVLDSYNDNRYDLEFHDPNDYYNDFESNAPGAAKRLCPTCRVHGARSKPAEKVLCWEDIELWILQNPAEDGGRDTLGMTMTLNYQKGSDRNPRPTRFIFTEESLPVICPVSHILAKAIAERVIQNEGYSRAEHFFQTRLQTKAVKVEWKEEFLHCPVFRKTVRTDMRFTKSFDPLPRNRYDRSTTALGKAAGLPDNLRSYDMRRGLLLAVNEGTNSSVRKQVARHTQDKTFETYYVTTQANVSTQDLFMGRKGKSPYLALFNQMGLQIDENAPFCVPDEYMEKMPLTPQQEEIRAQRELVGHGDDGEIDRLKKKERAASDRRKKDASDAVRALYFKHKNREELDRQLAGESRPDEDVRQIKFTHPQRQLIADIIGNMDEELPGEALLQRKVRLINAWVDYAWTLEVKENTGKAYRSASASILDSKTAEPETRGGGLSTTQPTFLAAEASRRGVIPIASNQQLPEAGPSGLVIVPQPPPKPPVNRKKPAPCIFCGTPFTRTGSMWDHVERHIEAARDRLFCPHADCTTQKEPFESVMWFKNHVYMHHRISLRP